MSDLPTSFIADLRYPRGYPDLDAGQWFQWRSVPMIELSALDTYQFVKSVLPHPARQILEIGNGYLTLELARDGHEVIGVDLSPEIIEVAEQSKAAHPDPPGFGSLRYICTDVNTWQAPDASNERASRGEFWPFVQGSFVLLYRDAGALSLLY